MQHTLYKLLQIIQQYERSVNFGVEIWTRALSAQSCCTDAITIVACSGEILASNPRRLKYVF